MPEFARRMDYMAGSAAVIRGLFGAMNDPETISFGGGAPASFAGTAASMRAILAERPAKCPRKIPAAQKTIDATARFC